MGQCPFFYTILQKNLYKVYMFGKIIYKGLHKQSLQWANIHGFPMEMDICVLNPG